MSTATAGTDRAVVRALTMSLPAGADQRAVGSAASHALAIGADLERSGYPVQTVRVAGPAVATAGSADRLAERAAVLADGSADAGVDSVSLGALWPVALGGLSSTGVAELLLDRPQLFLSVVVADGSSVDPPAVEFAAEVVMTLAKADPEAAFRFSAIANLPPHGAFFPGSYSRGEEPGLSIGLESAGCLLAALPAGSALRRDEITALTRTCLQAEIAALDGVLRAVVAPHLVVIHGYDPSPACSPDHSIAEFVERAGGVPFGTPGTLGTIAAITEAVRSLGRRSVGYAGLMLPVLEDRVLARAWEAGRITSDALLAYSAVCGAGLDTVPLSGGTTLAVVRGLVHDLAALSARWRKPLSARVMPAAPGSTAAETDYTSEHLINLRFPTNVPQQPY